MAPNANDVYGIVGSLKGFTQGKVQTELQKYGVRFGVEKNWTHVIVADKDLNAKAKDQTKLFKTTIKKDCHLISEKWFHTIISSTAWMDPVPNYLIDRDQIKGAKNVKIKEVEAQEIEEGGQGSGDSGKNGQESRDAIAKDTNDAKDKGRHDQDEGSQDQEDEDEEEEAQGSGDEDEDEDEDENQNEGGQIKSEDAGSTSPRETPARSEKQPSANGDKQPPTTVDKQPASNSDRNDNEEPAASIERPDSETPPVDGNITNNGSTPAIDRFSPVPTVRSSSLEPKEANYNKIEIPAYMRPEKVSAEGKILGIVGPDLIVEERPESLTRPRVHAIPIRLAPHARDLFVNNGGGEIPTKTDRIFDTKGIFERKDVQVYGYAFVLGSHGKVVRIHAIFQGHKVLNAKKNTKEGGLFRLNGQNFQKLVSKGWADRKKQQILEKTHMDKILDGAVSYNKKGAIRDAFEPDEGDFQEGTSEFQREKTIFEREKAVFEQEKSMFEREKSIFEREKSVFEREKSVREKSVL